MYIFRNWKKNLNYSIFADSSKMFVNKNAIKLVFHHNCDFYFSGEFYGEFCLFFSEFWKIFSRSTVPYASTITLIRPVCTMVIALITPIRIPCPLKGEKSIAWSWSIVSTRCSQFLWFLTPCFYEQAQTGRASQWMVYRVSKWKAVQEREGR